jgi:hypothetical protein
MEKTREAQTGNDFIGGINYMAFHPADFVEVVTRAHRTLQQSAFKLFMACIKEWATHEYYDARNEATVKLSRRIVAALGDDVDSIPFI